MPNSSTINIFNSIKFIDLSAPLLEIIYDLCLGGIEVWDNLGLAHLMKILLNGVGVRMNLILLKESFINLDFILFLLKIISTKLDLMKKFYQKNCEKKF